MANLITPNRPSQGYRGKQKFCERCGKPIFFECRFDETGKLITKDGLELNGKEYPDNNLKWFCIDALSLSDHKCSSNEL